MDDVKIIICPHCRSEIPHGAKVCRGCQAEITYGISGFMMGFLGIVSLIGACLVEAILNNIGFAGHPNIKTFLSICAFLAIAFYLLRWGFNKYEDDIDFVRTKNK